MSEISPSQAAAPQENKMGVMPCGKLLAGMAVPMMISMLVQALYNVVDSYFVAQISEDALNAVSLAFPVQNLMIAVAVGTGVGINALLSRSLGEKNQAMVDKAANTGIFLALCNFVVFALIGIFLSRPFFELQAGGEQVIVDYGVDYASICLGLSIGLFSQFCFERLLQSTGRTTLAMITQLTGAVINIIMDPILIFGYFGFPRLEVAGRELSQNLRLYVRGPEHVCILGPNGAGKTTLLRQIAGELLKRGDIRAAYMPQDYGETVNQDLTPVEFLAKSWEKAELTKVKTYLGSMKYTAEEQGHAVRELSGGQKAKLFFLKMILDGCNVLVLDEPTRNFSPLSGPVIRGILEDFPGCIISVSHDRKYIGQVCDMVYQLEPQGLVPVENQWR